MVGKMNYSAIFLKKIKLKIYKFFKFTLPKFCYFLLLFFKIFQLYNRPPA